MKNTQSGLTRRRMIRTTAGAVAGFSVVPALFSHLARPTGKSRIPLVHVTDLYHPPQDPDDHLDLLTVAALDEFDLKGVVLDVTQKFLDPAPAGFDKSRNPGFIPVAQLAHLLGRSIPVASGPTAPLRDPSDPCTDRSGVEQTGIQLLIDILKASKEPAMISCVGSARVVAAAFNREPDLLRAKVKAVLLNAGATGGAKREWNVNLDLAAYVRLWQSGLPIHWYPCATEKSAFNAAHERGTYWKATHSELFKDLSDPLRAWITFGFTGDSRNDFIGALSEKVTEPTWERVCAGERNMWSTASLVMAAGRDLALTGEGWRFLPAKEVAGRKVWPWRLDPIEASADSEGWIRWSVTEKESPCRLFGRENGVGYGPAMAEALNALLRNLGSHL